jgi:hypothetical protein
MPAKIELDVRGAEAYVRAQALIWVTQICLMTVRRAKELLSVAGTGKVKGKRTGPVVHSAPGEPPRKQTGRGRASVTYEVDAATLTGRVGTNVDYMSHQERGTKRGIKPRPWLRPAADWAAQQMKP